MMNTFLLNLVGLLAEVFNYWHVKLIKKRIKKLKRYNSWHTSELNRNNYQIECYEKYLNK